MNEKKEKTMNEKILDSGEKDYSYITALKEKAEGIAKISTLNLNDDEIKMFYNHYRAEAELLKNKIKIEDIK